LELLVGTEQRSPRTEWACLLGFNVFRQRPGQDSNLRPAD
jgi:hypothetical protein